MDAHVSEYLAAVEGMADHTPAPVMPERGDQVAGVTNGRSWSGRVEWASGRDVIVNGGGWWAPFPIADITRLVRGDA